MVIILGGYSQTGASFPEKVTTMQFGQVKQIWTGSTYAVDDFVLFDMSEAKTMVIEDVQYFLVADTSIRFTETAPILD